MKYILKVGWLIVVMTVYVFPAFTQNLFESSLSGNHENSVSSYLSMGGFIRSVAYIGTTPVEENPYLQSAYGEAGLLLNANVSRWARAKADIRFRAGSEYQETLSELNIREAYVDLTAGPAGLRAGKLITSWGKSTIFNPVEKITPLDPTVRSPDEDDMKLGAWALQGRINLGQFMKLTATWKPVYQSSVLLIDPVPMPGYVNFLDPGYPGPELNKGSYGIKYDIYIPLLDVALYWFEGYHHWPGIAFDSFVMDSMTFQPAALNIREEAYRIRMLGMDLSVPLGSWILRAEGAWQQTAEMHEEHEYLPFPELSYTAELERSGTYFTLLSGYYGKYILDYTTPETEPSLDIDQDQFFQLMQQGMVLNEGTINGLITGQIDAFNRLYNYQLEEYYHTVFLICKVNLWNDVLEFTLPAIYNITAEEWILRPGISYSPADGVKISGGFSGLYGRENSLYNMVGPVLNAGYLSLKLTF